MARYIGPKTKVARKFGEAIFGEDSYFEKRNYPPGQHVWPVAAQNAPNMPPSFRKSRKPNTLTAYSKGKFHNMFRACAAFKRHHR